MSPAATLLLAAGSAAGLLVARLLTPAAVTSGPIICPFRLVTGLPCPGCGMTRAWVFAAHGDVSSALAANPFVVVALPAALALVAAVASTAVRRRPPPDIGQALRSRVALLVAAAWVAFGLVRALLVATGRVSV